VGVADDIRLATLMESSEMGNTFLQIEGRDDSLVPTFSLDAIAPLFSSRTSSELTTTRRVNLMKLDVEGMEMKVLLGCTQILATHRPIIICEAVAKNLARFGTRVEDILQLISSAGYVPRELPGTCDPNFVFLPIEAAQQWA
jgi:hypothetical protein